MGNIYIALENIRSLHNVGAIFRTCSFFGFKNILLVGYTARDINNRLHTKISRSSLDSEKDLEIKFLEDSAELIKFAKETDLKLISVEQNEKSMSVDDYKLKKSAILVFGNEKDGVSNKILDESETILEISRYGKHNSLNVSTSVGITLYSLTTNLKKRII